MCLHFDVCICHKVSTVQHNAALVSSSSSWCASIMLKFDFSLLLLSSDAFESSNFWSENFMLITIFLNFDPEPFWVGVSIASITSTPARCTWPLSLPRLPNEMININQLAHATVTFDGLELLSNIFSGVSEVLWRRSRRFVQEKVIKVSQFNCTKL